MLHINRVFIDSDTVQNEMDKFDDICRIYLLAALILQTFFHNTAFFIKPFMPVISSIVLHSLIASSKLKFCDIVVTSQVNLPISSN